MDVSSSNSSSLTTSRRATAFRLGNPFTFKVGQVFTGFGVGCGVGIGVGRPINLGAIPVVNQVMSATSGATGILSGVARHVNDSLRKLGAKNIEAGIGCGVGFGHGFGVGIAVKPGVMHQVQSCVLETMTKVMTKFGIAPNLSTGGQGILPPSLQSGMSMMNGPANQNPTGNMMQLAAKAPQGFPANGNLNVTSTYETFASKGGTVEASFGSRTEKVLSSFMQNPVMKGGTDLNEEAVRLQSENKMLQMVLRHQQVIEELMEENEKLRQILIKDLKVPPEKLEASYRIRKEFPCADCFECRRKQRKHR